MPLCAAAQGLQMGQGLFGLSPLHHLVIFVQFTCHTCGGAGENLKVDKQNKQKTKQKRPNKKDKSRLERNMLLIQGND